MSDPRIEALLAFMVAQADQGMAGLRAMMRSYGGGPGLDYVFRGFKPRLERELGQELSERIFVANPARAFSFEPRA